MIVSSGILIIVNAVLPKLIGPCQYISRVRELRVKHEKRKAKMTRRLKTFLLTIWQNFAPQCARVDFPRLHVLPNSYCSYSYTYAIALAGGMAGAQIHDTGSTRNSFQSDWGGAVSLRQ